jgi:hypothetical protein
MKFLVFDRKAIPALDCGTGNNWSAYTRLLKGVVGEVTRTRSLRSQRLRHARGDAREAGGFSVGGERVLRAGDGGARLAGTSPRRQARVQDTLSTDYQDCPRACR